MKKPLKTFIVFSLILCAIVMELRYIYNDEGDISETQLPKNFELKSSLLFFICTLALLTSPIIPARESFT